MYPVPFFSLKVINLYGDEVLQVYLVPR